MLTAPAMSKSMPSARGSLDGAVLVLGIWRLTCGKNVVHAPICGMCGGGGGIVYMKTYEPVQCPPAGSFVSDSARPLLSVVPLLSVQCCSPS